MAIDERLLQSLKREVLTFSGQADRLGRRDEGRDSAPPLLSVCPAPRGMGLLDARTGCVKLIYVCDGAITYQADGSVLRLAEGDMLLIGRGVAHSPLPEESDALAVILYFYPDLLEELCREQAAGTPLALLLGGSKSPRVPFLHFSTAGHRSIEHGMELLLEETLQGYPNMQQGAGVAIDNSVARACGHLLLYLLCRDLSALDSGSVAYFEQETLRLIHSYIDQNYRDASLQELAKLLRCSQSAASRQIHRLTGATFTQLVQDRRFERARLFLEDSMLPVSEIAAAVGYENFSYFYRCFRRRFGCSPNRYRQLYDRSRPDRSDRRTT